MIILPHTSAGRQAPNRTGSGQARFLSPPRGESGGEGYSYYGSISHGKGEGTGDR